MPEITKGIRSIPTAAATACLPQSRAARFTRLPWRLHVRVHPPHLRPVARALPSRARGERARRPRPPLSVRGPGDPGAGVGASAATAVRAEEGWRGRARRGACGGLGHLGSGWGPSGPGNSGAEDASNRSGVLSRSPSSDELHLHGRDHRRGTKRGRGTRGKKNKPDPIGQISFSSGFFLNERTRELPAILKRRKPKNSTVQSALSCHAPKVKYAYKRIKKKAEELHHVLLRPLSKVLLHL